MNIKILDSMHDTRIGGRSLMVRISVRDYWCLVQTAYNLKGSIDGQRSALKSSTALRIRERMSEDFRNGAILPPVVLGIPVGEDLVAAVASWSADQLAEYLAGLDKALISIIDGMQRTTVLQEHLEAVADREIRAEFWFVEESSSLTYRMLVLNTGQVPWNLRRQMEVINAALITEIRQGMATLSVNDPVLNQVEVFGIEDDRRRWQAGQYKAANLVELYIAFGLRKAKIDKESVLVDQFSRLDMVDAVADRKFFKHFIQVFSSMVRLDLAFGRLPDVEILKGRKYSRGRSIFDSQPACVGFMAAAGQLIFGRPGSPRRDPDQLDALVEQLARRCSVLADKANGIPVAEMVEFLDLITLNEVMSQQTGKIGDFERSVFRDGFRLLFSEDADWGSLTALWRAH